MIDRHRVGQIEITRIVELNEPFLTPEKMFAEATPEAIAPHLEWLLPNGMCPDSGRLILPIQTYLIRTPHHVALVDTCIGNHKSMAGFKRWAGRDDQQWLAQLAAAGVQPEDVDFVFCTHLHLDHCGWNTRLVDGRWVPTFPNARYLFAKDEYAYAERRAREEADPVFAENVLPVMEAGCGELVAGDFVLNEHLYFESTPGHTPGHVVFYSPEIQRAFVGDVLVAGSIGRTDFPQGNHQDLIDSITQRLWPMGNDTVFIPGHGPESTFGRERLSNPYVGGT